MSMNLNVKWINYFFDIAKLTASMSKDPSTKVGAVFVTADKPHRVISTGYNGFCHGVDDDQSRYQDRALKLQYVVHAEANCVVSAAVVGTPIRGCVAFVTAPLCIDCAKLLIQAGISEVYFLAESADRKPAPGVEDWRTIRDKAFVLFRETGIPIYKCQLNEDSLSCRLVLPGDDGFEWEPRE